MLEQKILASPTEQWLIGVCTVVIMIFLLTRVGRRARKKQPHFWTVCFLVSVPALVCIRAIVAHYGPMASFVAAIALFGGLMIALGAMLDKKRRSFI